MATRRLLFPDHVRGLLARRFANQHRLWLAGDGTWPLTVSLGHPGEKAATEHADSLRAWVSSWEAWRGPGALDWHERQWRTIGIQRLPRRLVLSDAAQVADWLGERARWERAHARFLRMTERWPAMATSLPRFFEALAGYTDPDFERLEKLLAWLEAHPASNVYPRQLPIPGIDSKWLESRKNLVATLLASVQRQSSDEVDFYQCCGLKPLPRQLRMRLLDPDLRSRVGGLGDITAPLDDLAGLALPLRRVYIIENVQTGLAFSDLSGSAVLMGLGYGVEALARLPWLAATPCVYWGDIDTHGFAIVSRARAFLPDLQSVLMDAATLLNYRELWCEEKQQHPAADLPRLTEDERAVFCALKAQHWGLNVRLEQERIPWDDAQHAIRQLVVD